MLVNRYRELIVLVCLPCMLVLLSLGCQSVAADQQTPQRPNIVWIMAEDIGPDLACYGTAGLQTPVLDELAEQGLKLNRLYCTSPICSPNRSAMMTGMYQTTIGAHHHRSHRGDGYTLPDPVRPFTHLLQEAGYFCTTGNGYGNKTDLNYRTRIDGQPPLFNAKDWSQREEGQPFFAQITLHITHRGGWWKKTRRESDDPVDPAQVELPPYLPDHPDIRMDWALYLDQMEKADMQVGKILDRLESEGIADNTVVIFIGDNGRCVFRGKGFLYEDGIRVPGIIRWPDKIKPGKVSDELVSTIDITAQILAAAGVDVPDWMQGRAFLEDGVPEREACFAARDRWDEVYDKCRTVVESRYKYIRNDMPQVPVFTYQDYLERVRPIRPVMWSLFEAGKMNPQQAQFMAAQRPEEELYDLSKDPWELNNLAGDPEHAETLKRLRTVLTEWEETTDDKGRYPEPPEAVGEKVLKKIAHRESLLEQGLNQ